MPRAATFPYTFSLEPVYLAVSGQPILASSSNTTLQDIQDTFNTVQPINFGGTGASSAGAALAALGGVGAAGPFTAPVINGAVSGTSLAVAADALAASSSSKLLVPANLATDRGIRNDPFINLALSATVAASALTVSVLGTNGSAPSATNPVYVSFRSATLTSGLTSQLTLTAALSIVVSSGSTLGSTSAVATTYALAVFNDAGAARMAIINPMTLPLTDGIDSATSEGGSGAADSAGVWYSNAAITSKAYTIVGYITATEATAGTWATAPSTVQVAPAPATTNAISPGGIKLGTAVATTSGTEADFTNIPAWVKRITFNFFSFSTNGTADPVIQMGTSSGYETTGYNTGASRMSTTVASSSFTTGFGLTSGWAAAIVLSGSITFILLDPSTNTWSAMGVFNREEVTATATASGRKSLAGTLDRIRLITTDTMDGGKVNITYE